ncbi:MAG: hypothetical protein KY453_04975 [Gemmatimonadetes bacterium]|nr:hypothetical protein [Gemmatimonadota bacterium]
MLKGIRRRWRELKASEPGRRFQDRYERSHQEGDSRTRRVLTMGAGVLIVLAGLFFLPAPGPGVIIVALGAALVARESRRVASLLDAAEVRGRRILTWARRRWKTASTPARGLAVLTAAILAGAGAWAAWKILLA